MKHNTILFALLLTLSLHQIGFTQDNNKDCSCQLLEETEENDAKVIALAEYIQDSFFEYEKTGFDEKFDKCSFENRIVSGYNIDTNDEFTKGFLSGINDTTKGLSQNILNAIENGAYYNLVNYQYSAEVMTYYFTFRLYSEDIGINYHDYQVCWDGEKFKFNDIYIYITGENISSTLRRVLLLSQPSKKTFKKLFNKNTGNEFIKLLEAKEFAEKGNFKKAYETIDELKGPFSKEKFVLLLKGNYASNYNDKIYEEDLVEFAELYPNDPTLYLKEIDFNILKGDFDKALQNVNKLEYETEDDFLNLIRGNLFMMSEDFEKAEKNYKYMIDNYPDLLEGYVGYIVSLNFQERFEEIISTVEILIEKGYEKKLLVDFLEEDEADGSNPLEAFLASKVYKKWKRKS
ncbi:tetratricopeptide repeat protein [Winogradskyella tangerina]|uniref:tetratricopeptide repeat protein n=1 Tax=Winogradskyella tangerina TaxID=2023240 RepID=UPI000DBEA33D|nr:hypothetical protein [Winogradskyella tangerina]